MLPKGLLKEYPNALAWILRCLDVATVVFAGCVAYEVKFGNWQIPDRYQIAMMVAGLLIPTIFRFFQVYESIRVRGFSQHLLSLAQGVLALLVMLAGFAFFTKTGEDFSRAWFAWWAGLAFVSLFLFRGSLLLLLSFMRTRGWNERRVLVVGASELRDQLVQTIHEAVWTGFRIVGCIDDVESIDAARLVSDYVTQQQIDEVWMVLPLSAEPHIQKITHALRHQMVTTRLVLDIFSLNLLNHSITNLAGFPVLNICSSPMVGMNRLLKALEDRVLALLILCLISPLLACIAVAVKLSSKGPVFYKQKRVSWNGKEFNMLKFRSMPVDAEARSGPVWAKAGEDRATRVGAFLRRTSLDELPQFINVVLGDMSIVGPRPERLVFVEEFKDKIPGYMQKHLVKAGITGWAQINGWRGNTSLEKRIEYDLYYIQNWSLWFDLKIIFFTFVRGFSHKNAY